MPDGLKIARMPKVGETGIDDLYKVNRPDVIVEYKFVGADGKTGAQVLGKTQDGVQGSQTWIAGGERLAKAVNSKSEADAVLDAIKQNRTESWVVTTRPDGSTFVQVLDAVGKPKPIDTSKIIPPNVSLSGAKP